MSNNKKPDLSKGQGVRITPIPMIGAIVYFYPCKPLSEGWGGRNKFYPAIIIDCVDSAPSMTVLTDVGAIYFPTVIPKSDAFTPSGSQHSHYWDWKEIK